METNQNGREDRPNAIDPNDVGKIHPAKEIKAQEKIDIVQSGLGRDQGQTPADEHIEDLFSQIDDDTKALHESRMQREHESGPEAETRDSAGYLNDETSADRDIGNSHGDGWETSRTSRHK